MAADHELLRQIPQVERLLGTPPFRSLIDAASREEVTRGIRVCLGHLREAAIRGESLEESVLSPEALAARVASILEASHRPFHTRVINGTGIILHTGLGRAVLPREAVDALARGCSGYVLVEVDPRTGERGRREDYLASLIAELTGAEDATVVNNNAAATLLILNALAGGREVILSRGEMIEIGGSYRIPEILEQSGARLVSVGTTNRTHLRDYETAVGDGTALILKVHTSNYRICGFSASVLIEDLVRLGKERGVPVVHDLGSGCFVDLARFGLGNEPLVQGSIRAGASLICFSGDKLLGGPQAGIIAGERDLVRTVRRHPLARAVRVGKLTLAALEATLKLYRDKESLPRRLPVLEMLSATTEELTSRAERIIDAVREQAPGIDASIEPTTAQAGGGSLPQEELPSRALSVRCEGMSADDLAARLRACEPPVFSRIREDRVLLDMRTILPGDEADAVRALVRAAPSR